MNRCVALLLSLFCIAGLAHAQASIFNHRLMRAYQHYDKTLHARRQPLLFDSGRTANNCSEYFRQKKSSAISEGVNNQIAAQDYVVCDSVKLLKQANVRQFSRNRSHSYGKDLLQRLDLRSFPSSLRQSVDDNHFVLGTLQHVAAQAGHYAAVSNTSDWFFKIEVAAEWDMEGDGERDWLLWMIDSAKGGNYRSYKALIVRHPYRNSLLRAEIVP